jgi:hypothetical protein
LTADGRKELDKDSEDFDTLVRAVQFLMCIA